LASVLPVNILEILPDLEYLQKNWLIKQKLIVVESTCAFCIC